MADFPDSTTLPEISRPIVEAQIERLIDLLDTLDPDPDLESTADEEPWLGASAGIQSNGHGTNWHGWSANDDREDDCEDEGAQCDDEGSYNWDQEPDHDDGFGEETVIHHYCSPMETMFPQLPQAGLANQAQS